MGLVCAIELKNMVNKKAIFRFRVPRGIIKSESCRCALSFRFSFTPGRWVRWRGGGGGTRKRKGTKRKRHPRRRPQSSSYWFIGITERSARPDPARPGPGSRVATSIPKGWKRASVPVGVPGTGSGSLPGHWLFMKPRFEIERHNEALPGIVELSIVWQLLQRIRPFIRFPRLPISSATEVRSRNVTDVWSFIRSSNVKRIRTAERDREIKINRKIIMIDDRHYLFPNEATEYN